MMTVLVTFNEIRQNIEAIGFGCTDLWRCDKILLDLCQRPSEVLFGLDRSNIHDHTGPGLILSYSLYVPINLINTR